MDNVVFPIAIVLALMDVIAASTDWATAKLHLFTNNVTPTADNVLADFTEATFDGYAAASITWSDAFIDRENHAVVSGGETIFAQTGDSGDVIYGAFVTNAAGSKLLAAGRLDIAPFGLEVSGDALPVTLKIALGSGTVAVSATP